MQTIEHEAQGNPMAAGAQAVFTLLAQMAYADPIQHEAKVADAIRANMAGATPDLHAVSWGVIDSLLAAANGLDLELTMQALGYYNGDPVGEFYRDQPETPGEHLAVFQAQAYAKRMADALVALLHRPRHGLQGA